MKNILLIAFDCNPNDGSEAMFAYSWVILLQKHYKVNIITDIRNKKSIQERDSSLSVTYCSFVSEKIRPILYKLRAYNVLYMLFIHKINRTLKHDEIEKIDLIHCLTPAGYYAYNNLYKLGKPVISGPLGGGLKLPGYFKQYETARYKIRQLYYILIKINPKWINYYKKCIKILIGTPNLLLHLPKDTHFKTIEFFDTVVDTNKFKPGLNKNSKYTTILFSGRMEATKGCLLLIESFKLLLKSGYSSIQLIMLGTGTEYNHLLRIVKSENLEEYIHLLGKVTSNEVSDYLKKADIFCLPSLKEPGGTSILEAMACALPIVTTDYGGPAVSVTDECGIKIKPSGYDSYLLDLKNALAFLIDNEDIRKKMGSNARDRVVNEYSLETLENRIKNLYDDIFYENQNSLV